MKPTLFRLFILLLLVTFSHQAIQAQDKMIDSLLKVVSLNKKDTGTVKALDELSWLHLRSDQKKAMQFATRQKQLAEDLNYKPGIATAHFNLGALLYMQSNYKEAILEFEASFHLKNELHDLKGAAGVLNNIAMSWQQLGEYPKAINYYLKAVKLFEELNDAQRLASTCNNVAALYVELKNYQSALSFAERSKKLYSELKDTAGLSGVYVNIGNIYNQQKNNVEAKIYYEKVVSIEQKLGNKYYLSRAYHNLGAINLDEKNYTQAERYFTLSLQLKKELDDKEGLTSDYYGLGSLYSKTGRYSKSLEMHQAAVALSKSINYRDGLRWAYLGIKDTYAGAGKFKEALEYFTLYELTKDTLYNEDNTRKIAEMQTKYETEKKEKENIELKRVTEIQALEIENESQKRKSQLYFAVSIFMVISAASFLVYYKRQLKQREEHNKEMASAEKARFRAVIEAGETERVRIAKDLHDGLGQMLSAAKLNVSGLEESVPAEDKALFDLSVRIIDDACVEVRTISHNMMPSALIRLGIIPAIHELAERTGAAGQVKVNFDTNVSRSFGQATDISLYRIIQEAVNNMIKHANASLIQIHLNNSNGKINLKIVDNGKGFDTSIIEQSKGIGWKNIYSRVAMLNGQINIESTPGKGTTIFINFETTDEQAG